jgi:hypothetical protein
MKANEAELWLGVQCARRRCRVPALVKSVRGRDLVEAFGAGGVLVHLPDRLLKRAGGGEAGNQLALQVRGPAVGAFDLSDDGIEGEKGRDLGIGGEGFEIGDFGGALESVIRDSGADEILIGKS